jgi:hypothetical protein
MPVGAAIAAILSVVVNLAGVAHAGPGEEADAAIERGYRLMQKGKFEDALEAFRAAHKLAPGPRTIVQMGFAESGLGSWFDSEDHLAEGLRQVDDKWIRKNEPQIRDALAKVQAHIPRLTVHGPEGALVWINGEPHGVLPLEGPVRCPAGPVTVRVRAVGTLAFSQTIDAKEGLTIDVVAVLKPKPAAEPPAPSAAAAAAGSTANPPAAPPLRMQSPAPLSTGVWIGAGLVAVGAAGLLAGGYYLGMDGKPACLENPSAPCATTYDGKVPGWLFASSGVLAIGGGTWLIVSSAGSGRDAGKVAMRVGPSSFAVAGTF